MSATQSKLETQRASAKKAADQKVEVGFSREICGVLDVAELREWLVTNGVGGFASGTVSGNLTRRYHGLLVAALSPPVGRMQLVAKLDETARYDDTNYALATNRWESGAIEPKGYLNIESFRLDGVMPVWQFAIADALLEKRIWMQHGDNTTYVQYTLLRGSGPVDLEIKSFVNYRDFHSSTHAGDWQIRIDAVKNGVQVLAFEGAIPFYLMSAEATPEARHAWYRDYSLPQEKYRGLDDHEDHLFAAVFRATLQQDQSVTLVSHLARKTRYAKAVCSPNGRHPIRKPHQLRLAGCASLFSQRTNSS
jgi:predicted glycogen debranching enzyme